MSKIEISKDIRYIGADDKDIDLFESQYIVPNGISYNSYLIKDEKNVVIDTIDKRKTAEWLENLERELNGENLDFLVVSHLEPDHAYNIEVLSNKYPNMKIIGNSKTFSMLPQFFNIDNLENRKIEVKEGDTISFGKHTMQFIMAPMVHWPEVMMEYEKTEKVLFAADAFGKFGALDCNEDWACEARRYYFNIVGKYGAQVQNVLKKVGKLEINTICPLHGPILKENLGNYINKYDVWSSYKPEEEGIFIACSSIHGNTLEAMEFFKKYLSSKTGKKVVLSDITRCDMAEAIEDAFRYDTLVIASSSYNFGLFPKMEEFLNHLKGKNYQNRKIAIIENGSWAPSAGKCMKEIVEQMKDIKLFEPLVTIKSRLNEDSKKQLMELSENILKEEV